MPKFMFAYKYEHHYCNVIESLYTPQIFKIPLCILVNGDHLLNEYWECPQSEKMCSLKMKFYNQNIPEVVNCFSEKSTRSPHTFNESNMIIRQFTMMVGMKNMKQELTLSILQIKAWKEYWVGQKPVNRALTMTP